MPRLVVTLLGVVGVAACGNVSTQPSLPVMVQAAAHHRGAWQILRDTSGSAEGIVRSRSGDFWVANSSGATLSRFRPDGEQRVFRLGKWQPEELTVDGSGMLWFTNTRYLNTVLRFDPVTFEVTPIELTDNVGGGIMLGKDGNIWVLQTSHVAKVSTAGNVTEYVVPYTIGGSGLTWASGLVWFNTYIGIASVDPQNGAVRTYHTPTGGTAIVGSRGLLFSIVGYSDAPTKIIEFDLKGRVAKSYPCPRRFYSAGTPGDLALAPDGNVWYATQHLNSRANRVIGGGFVLFDVTSKRFTTYASPKGTTWNWDLTVAPDGKVWGTASDAVTVLDPRSQ